MKRSFVIAATVLATITQAQAHKAKGEYEVKAAFIYNFAKFTEWPANSSRANDGELTVCIAANQTISHALESLEGKQVKGRSIKVRKIQKEEEAEACQIIFVATGEERNKSKIIAAATDHPILTISEHEGQATQGDKGVINFISVNNKIRFEIDQKAARRRGLAFSSHVLKLAYRLIE